MLVGVGRLERWDEKNQRRAEIDNVRMSDENWVQSWKDSIPWLRRPWYVTLGLLAAGLAIGAAVRWVGGRAGLSRTQLQLILLAFLVVLGLAQLALSRWRRR